MKKINLVRSIVDADALVEGKRAVVITMGGQDLRTSPVEKIYTGNNGQVYQIETRNTIYQIKKIIMVRGCDMGSLAVGKSATVFCSTGSILKTSPVLAYNVSSNVVYIETEHSIYKNL